MTALGCNRSSFLCLDSTADGTEETPGAVFVSAVMQLLKVVASAFLKRNGSSHIAAFFSMRFVSHASLKSSRKAMIEIKALGLKRCVFICDMTFFTNRVS